MSALPRGIITAASQRSNDCAQTQQPLPLLLFACGVAAIGVRFRPQAVDHRERCCGERVLRAILTYSATTNNVSAT
jgi:hypothetical protein